MKLVTWNCRQAFDQKYEEFHKEFKADIYVIQECASPDILKSKNPGIFKDYPNVLWKGDNEQKGLCVLSRMKLEELKWEAYGLRYFIPCKVDDTIDLLALWEPHIEEFFVYEKINGKKFSNKQIIVGDFNANAKSDYKHGVRCFSNVAKNLGTKGLISAYHEYTRENLGEEKQPTYYKGGKSRQNDYCFVPTGTVKSVIVGNNKWLKYSDHTPVYVEI